MPYSITKYIHSEQNRAQTLVREWKTPKNAGKILVLVEGWEDILVYEQFFKTEVTSLKDCHGCDNAIALNTSINKIASNIARIVIVDSDFRFFYDRNKKKSNIFFTDTHDMETLVMFNPNCFQKIIKNLKCTSLTHKSIVKDLRLLSYIRWYNYDAKMKYVDYGLDIVNMSNSKMSDYESLMNCFIPSSGTTKKWLKRCFFSFKSKNFHAMSEHLINGHDYVDRFCHYVKLKNKIQLSNEDVLIEIAKACDHFWFKSTRLGKELSNWQKEKGITILS